MDDIRRALQPAEQTKTVAGSGQTQRHVPAAR